jgi:DNA (cytosine-5)-methyltransferase 1
MPSFYEFFAGGGMVRAGLVNAGLESGWDCLFANDIDAKKAASYQANWGSDAFRLGDVNALTAADLPGQPDLVWGSFPCQDLSLAGAGAGLQGQRSGAFYPFWRLIEALKAEQRAPKLVAIENVCGAITSRQGQDFQAICQVFAEASYRFGALVINAELFLPQSRPRLFVIGVRDDLAIDADLIAAAPSGPFHTPALRSAIAALPEAVKAKAIWWAAPAPPARWSRFADLIEESPNSVGWHAPEQTQRLIQLMSPANRAKLEQAKAAGRRMVGCVYRRTRTDSDGARQQRAEVRFDDLAGCLRTPAGGSSRQTIILVDGDLVRSRLISARETARLMGLPDSYQLPEGYNDAYHLTGDGVAVPVVRHLAKFLFEPILAGKTAKRRAA